MTNLQPIVHRRSGEAPATSYVREDARSPRRDSAARTFAELLFRYRISAALSRLELAGRVLCSENYIYRLESRDPRHRRVPTPWIVRAISEALGLNPEQAETLMRARDRLDRDVIRGPVRSGATGLTARLQPARESHESATPPLKHS